MSKDRRIPANNYQANVDELGLTKRTSSTMVKHHTATPPAPKWGLSKALGASRLRTWQRGWALLFVAPSLLATTSAIAWSTININWVATPQAVVCTKHGIYGLDVKIYNFHGKQVNETGPNWALWYGTGHGTFGRVSVDDFDPGSAQLLHINTLGGGSIPVPHGQYNWDGTEPHDITYTIDMNDACTQWSAKVT